MDVTLTVEALGPQLSGIGRYVWELCSRVPQQPGIDRLNFFANGRFVDGPQAQLHGNSARSHIRMPRWMRRRRTLRRLRQSLVHGPNYFLPGAVETGIITVHDLSVFKYPETHPAERLRAFERDFEHSLSRAEHVITDTETVRREVIGEFGLAEAKVTAIPLGVGYEYRPRGGDEIQPHVAPFGLAPGGYALSVSTLEPRKKISELIGAWRELPQDLRSSTPLVLAGAKGWLNENLHDEVREGVAAGWLRHLGFVPEEALLALYSGASLFIYPSVYEGFGLPPIEAMASGVPVLVANRSCLPEVSGDAAGYIDPDDPNAFSQAIAEALTDSAWRSQAREKGLERAAKFSWDRCAAQTAELYQRYRP
ncbi:MAG: glycosyltransferase family 4 protein [Myxococcales bacterium]